jgi:hypothetical protein
MLRDPLEQFWRFRPNISLQAALRRRRLKVPVAASFNRFRSKGSIIWKGLAKGGRCAAL